MNWIMAPVGFLKMYTIGKRLKRAKVPGGNGIINGMLKYGENRIVEVLCSLVNLVMESKYWPEDGSFKSWG